MENPRKSRADPGALPALSVPLPQEERAAARRSGRSTARLQSLTAFFRWLARQNYLLYNPASELMLPRLEKRLPKHVLTAAEAEQIIQPARRRRAEGLRDRAILETFYSTGMRRMEVADLKLYDLDLNGARS